MARLDVGAGFRSSSRSRDVGPAGVFAPIAHALVTWDLHRAAGFGVRQAPAAGELGGMFVARAPLVPVTSRCEVTAIIDEPGRAGFTYRTLPGHPLDGEETFLVEVVGDRTVFSVTERSRPATFLTRLPGARWVQGRINERYLAAAARAATAAQ